VADVFIEYVAADADHVDAIVRALKASGISAEWNQPYRFSVSQSEREEARRACKIVFVVWSVSSTASSYFQKEMEAVVETQISVPILIDESRIPLWLREQNAYDLRQWNGNPERSEWQKLLRHALPLIEAKGGPSLPPEPYRAPGHQTAPKNNEDTAQNTGTQDTGTQDTDSQESDRQEFSIENFELPPELSACDGSELVDSSDILTLEDILNESRGASRKDGDAPVRNDLPPAPVPPAPVPPAAEAHGTPPPNQNSTPQSSAPTAPRPARATRTPRPPAGSRSRSSLRASARDWVPGDFVPVSAVGSDRGLRRSGHRTWPAVPMAMLAPLVLAAMAGGAVAYAPQFADLRASASPDLLRLVRTKTEQVTASLRRSASRIGEADSAATPAPANPEQVEDQSAARRQVMPPPEREPAQIRQQAPSLEPETTQARIELIRRIERAAIEAQEKAQAASAKARAAALNARNGTAGYAIKYYSDGARYEGQISYGQRHGFGIYYYASGSRYEGEYSQDIRGAYGTYLFHRGDKYEGHFADGQLSGYGVYSFANGIRHFGELFEGELNGLGFKRNHNDRVFDLGTWRNNQLSSPWQG